MLPQVIRYNGIQSKKLSVWPKVERYCADEKYAKICRTLGLTVPSKEAAKGKLADARLNVGKDIGIARNCSSVIPDEKLDENKLEVLGYLAYEDPCTQAFLREPLVADMVQIVRGAYKRN